MKKREKRSTNRTPLPTELPRIVEIIDVPEEEKICGCCGGAQKKFAEESSETVEFIPAHFKVVVTNRPKYACPHCTEAGVTQALPPELPIPRSYARASLLAHIIISKFEDHLPLYRQSAIFKRLGFPISRQTMNDWLSFLASSLAPLGDALKKAILNSPYVQADEIPLTVLNQQQRNPKKKSKKGFFWGSHAPEVGVFFTYDNSRSAKVAKELFHNFHGILQTDDLSSYDQIVDINNIIHLICWAHVRRKFFEAQKEEPNYTEEILNLIGKLYLIEKIAREQQLSHKERRKLRQKKAPPIMKDLKKLLENPPINLLPQTYLGKAVNYALKNWQKLQHYIDHGEAEIDNNLMENQNRPIAVGRKNWLFAQHEKGAQKYALFYSIIATCKIWGVNTYQYLVDVIHRIQSYPHNKVKELLPANWKPA